MTPYETINETEKYQGKYVATKSFSSVDVVSYSKNPKKVLKIAKAKGITKPVVFYVEAKNSVNLY